MYYFFGEAKKIEGTAINQMGLYNAPDLITGNILFESNIVFTGIWSFASPEQKDVCEIIGTKGKIVFSIFNMKKITVMIDDEVTEYDFEPLQHVQQPMIEATVNYFLGKGSNPCPVEDGVLIMQWMKLFTS